MNIVAADIGGTKTHLAYINSDNAEDIIYQAKYNSAEFENFEQLLSVFTDHSGCKGQRINLLSLALPGVINNDCARLTNLSWVVDKRKLMQRFVVDRVHFMNDFQASALGTLQLGKEDYSVLNRGRQNTGSLRVAVGAGTGLGVSWLLDDGNRAVAHATEAGHMDFAPVGAEQIELLQFLMKRTPHVSCERILSGDGLVLLYEFISSCTVNNIEAAWVNQQANEGNEMARQALQLFVRIYAAYVGNLALMFKPEGGIYITGGIAIKMINWMQSDDFIQAYLNKGRMQQVVEQVAVLLVSNESVGVIGALSEAVKLLQDEKT